jgi:hypothetical protein
MRTHRALASFLVGWYLLLSFGHYLNQRPLWNDEQCVLNNILQLKPAELFSRPLLSNQAFPRAYLWVIQQVSGPFHQHLLVLRFFSLLAMLGAFVVWLKIGRRVLENSWDFVLFVGCWGASMPLVYYAAEIKPYSMDVLVSGLVVLFLLDPQTYRKAWPLLPWLGLFSYAAVFLTFLPLYQLIHDSLRQRRWLPELSLYLGSCALVGALLYLFDFRVSAHYLLEECWHDYFISLHSLKDFLNSLGKGLNNVIGRGFAESPKWVKGPSRIFGGLGLVYLVGAGAARFKKDGFALRSIAPLALALFIVQLVLALLRIYPLGVPRMSLYFLPLLVLMIIMALRCISNKCKALVIFQGLFAAYLVFISLGIAWDVFVNRDLGAESTLYSKH